MQYLVAERRLADALERLRDTCRMHARGAGTAWYRCAGHPVRMQLAGDGLAGAIARPFVHLRCEGPVQEPPALDVHACEGNPPHGIELPPPGSPAVTEVADSGRYILQRTSRSVMALDRRAGFIAGVFTEPPRADVYQRAKPFARLLAEWYADRGVAIVHAALVARGDDGVLLAGRGGAGKSTSALVCARAGLAVLGDDYAGLQLLPDGGVIGHSAYNSVFLDEPTAACFPEIAPHLMRSGDPAEPKCAIVLADCWPEALRASVRIRAVAVCRVAGIERSDVRPATPARTLLAIGPSSLLEIHGRRRDSLDRLAALVQRVPCFHLDLGRDRASLPAALDGVLCAAVSA